jgi:hypothetical protein
VAAREIEFAPGSGNAKAQLPDEPSGAAQALGGEEQKELSCMPASKGRVRGQQPMSSGEISTVFPRARRCSAAATRRPAGSHRHGAAGCKPPENASQVPAGLPAGCNDE